MMRMEFELDLVEYKSALDEYHGQQGRVRTAACLVLQTIDPDIHIAIESPADPCATFRWLTSLCKPAMIRG